MRHIKNSLFTLGALSLLTGCGGVSPLEADQVTAQRGEETSVTADGTIRSVTQYVGGRPNPTKKWVIQGPTGTRYILPSGLETSLYTDGLPVRFKLEVLSPNIAPDGYGLPITLIDLAKI